MKSTPIAEALKMTLTKEQLDMRDNLGNYNWWESRWQRDKEGVCADLMALYNVTGEETRVLIGNLIKDLSADIHNEVAGIRVEVSDIKEMLKRAMTAVGKVESNQIEAEFKRKSDVERLDKHEHEINLLRHGQNNVTLKVDSIEKNTSSIPDQLNNLSSSITALHQTVNNVMMQRSLSQSSQHSSVLSKIPIKVLVGVGVGVAAVLIFFVTGDDSILKFIGGAK